MTYLPLLRAIRQQQQSSVSVLSDSTDTDDDLSASQHRTKCMCHPPFSVAVICMYKIMSPPSFCLNDTFTSVWLWLCLAAFLWCTKQKFGFKKC